MYENVVYIPTKNYHKITVMIQAAIKCFTDNIFTTFFTVETFTFKFNQQTNKKKPKQRNFKLPEPFFFCTNLSQISIPTINNSSIQYFHCHC